MTFLKTYTIHEQLSPTTRSPRYRVLFIPFNRVGAQMHDLALRTH